MKSFHDTHIANNHIGKINSIERKLEFAKDPHPIAYQVKYFEQQIQNQKKTAANKNKDLVEAEKSTAGATKYANKKEAAYKEAVKKNDFVQEDTPQELFTMSENVETSPSNTWVYASAAVTAAAVGYHVYMKKSKSDEDVYCRV